MSDKDLLVVISEMLRKQDQQAEILSKHTQILGDTNKSLNNFVEISIEQFQQQQKFNELFLEKLDQVGERISANFDRQNEFNMQIMAQTDRQNEFNERFLSKLDEIAKKP
ncbi:hypothetical protein [Mucilaginibacter flavidus]|uniref:hypothetical protein n=1 Tax=Mucilaginibacter flavidus TaxID=2949309 RepID=UPI00209296E7|nr:hypothetical protein [Mucilaginibacter flavidus]MCO5950794.1 hypothetical protein [Mucilaginibacter flavidus]